MEQLDAIQRNDRTAAVYVAFGDYTMQHTQAQAAAGTLGGSGVAFAFADAADYYQRACKQDSTLQSAWVGAANALLWAGDSSRSATTAEEGLTHHPQDLALLLALGGARFACFQAASEEPERAQAELAAAEAAYRGATEEHEDSAAAARMLGDVLLWKADAVGAKAAYRTAMERDIAQVDLSRLVAGLGGQPAAELIAEYLSSHEETAELLFYLGYAEFFSDPRPWSDCRTHFEKALALNEDFTTCYYFLGQGALEEGTRLQGEGAQQDAKRLFYESAESWAAYLRAHGNQQLQTLAAQQDAGQAFFERMKWLSGMAYSGRRMEPSVSLSEWVVLGCPADVEAWNNLALFRRDLGASLAGKDPDRAVRLWNGALDAYRHAADLQPEDPQVLNDMAVILHYYLQKDDAEATDLYERAVVLAEGILDSALDRSSEIQRIETALRDARNNLAKLKQGNRSNF